MDLKVLFGLLFYWSMIFVLFGGVLSGDVLYTDYTTSGAINSTFDSSEVDIEEVGFFSTIGVVFGMAGRFIGLMAFGFTPVLTGDLQVLFSVITVIINVIGLGWLFSVFWNG